MPATGSSSNGQGMKKPGHRALRRGRVSLPGQPYLVPAVTRNRQPIFGDFEAACAACRCFVRPAWIERSTLLAWVLMPDHAHWMVELGEGGLISDVANRLKSATARAANRSLGRNGALWSAGYHDRALREEDDVRAAARYLVGNPLRAGLVDRIGDYPFWDAVWI